MYLEGTQYIYIYIKTQYATSVKIISNIDIQFYMTFYNLLDSMYSYTQMLTFRILDQFFK